MRLFRSVAATTVAVSALLLGAGQAFAMDAATTAAPGTAAPRLAAPGADFTGIAALSNCSASLIRFAESVSTDPALVLTNGHCYEGGMPSPGQVIVDHSSTRSITLLRPDSSRAGTIR